MSRFYFHIRDGQKLTRDCVGVELRSLRAAFDRAHYSARILVDRIRGGASIVGEEIEVEDETGTRLFSIPFKSVPKAD